MRSGCADRRARSRASLTGGAGGRGRSWPRPRSCTAVPTASACFHHGPVALAHRAELSIINLSHAGDQPMTDCADGQTPSSSTARSTTSRTCGPISRAGGTFRIDRRYGGDLRPLCAEAARLAMLRGMFAFAFGTTPPARLLLARDPFGEQAALLCDPPRRWSSLFASEVAAFWSAGRSNAADSITGRSSRPGAAVSSPAPERSAVEGRARRRGRRCAVDAAGHVRAAGSTGASLEPSGGAAERGGASACDARRGQRRAGT